MAIIVEFENESEVQRLIYLAHRDLARVVGEQVIAEERLDQPHNALPGRQRRKAHEILESAPQQERALVRAKEAMQLGLRKARADGTVG